MLGSRMKSNGMCTSFRKIWAKRPMIRYLRAAFIERICLGSRGSQVRILSPRPFLPSGKGVLERFGPSGSLCRVTQWFEKTGEFWGVGDGFLFLREGDRLTLATGYFYQRWLNFLEDNCRLALAHGGSLPIHIRLGVNNLRDSCWPRDPYQFDDEGYAAVEDSYEYDATLTSISEEALRQVTVDAFNGLAEAYGIQPHSYEQIVNLSG